MSLLFVFLSSLMIASACGHPKPGLSKVDDSKQKEEIQTDDAVSKAIIKKTPPADGKTFEPNTEGDAEIIDIQNTVADTSTEEQKKLPDFLSTDSENTIEIPSSQEDMATSPTTTQEKKLPPKASDFIEIPSNLSKSNFPASPKVSTSTGIIPTPSDRFTLQPDQKVRMKVMVPAGVHHFRFYNSASRITPFFGGLTPTLEASLGGNPLIIYDSPEPSKEHYVYLYFWNNDTTDVPQSNRITYKFFMYIKDDPGNYTERCQQECSK